MVEPQKPFVCYKGRWSIKFFARGAEGLKSLGYWFGGYVLAILVFLVAASHLHSRLLIVLSLMLIVVFTAVWSVRHYRWLLPRSDVIEIE